MDLAKRVCSKATSIRASASPAFLAAHAASFATVDEFCAGAVIEIMTREKEGFACELSLSDRHVTVGMIPQRFPGTEAPSNAVPRRGIYTTVQTYILGGCAPYIHQCRLAATANQHHDTVPCRDTQHYRTQ